jgi:hypothetical protein
VRSSDVRQCRAVPRFRLAAGRVTALLGPDTARRALLGRLDPGSARGVLTVTSARARSAAERIAALAQAAAHRPALVLVNPSKIVQTRKASLQVSQGSRTWPDAGR